MTRDELLSRIKENLAAAFGARFQGLVLYGSEARGKPSLESDIDLLVLLQGPIKLGRDLEKIINATYDLQLELIDAPGPFQSRMIHATPVDARAFQEAEYALYRNAKKEGIFW
jgi:predicted nucleotidyltransferase